MADLVGVGSGGGEVGGGREGRDIRVMMAGRKRERERESGRESEELLVERKKVRTTGSERRDAVRAVGKVDAGTRRRGSRAPGTIPETSTVVVEHRAAHGKTRRKHDDTQKDEDQEQDERIYDWDCLPKHMNLRVHADANADTDRDTAMYLQTSAPLHQEQPNPSTYQTQDTNPISQGAEQQQQQQQQQTHHPRNKTEQTHQQDQQHQHLGKDGKKEKDEKARQIFADLTLYLNGSTAPLISDHALKALFVQHGGRILLSFARREVTHVILGTLEPGSGRESRGRLAAGKMQREIGRVGGVRFVSVGWVLECVRRGRRVREAGWRVGV